MAGRRECDDPTELRIRSGSSFQCSPSTAALPGEDDLLDRNLILAVKPGDGRFDETTMIIPFQCREIADLGEQYNVIRWRSRPLKDGRKAGLKGGRFVRGIPVIENDQDGLGWVTPLEACGEELPLNRECCTRTADL